MIFMHQNDDEDAWWNKIPYELKCKGEIECYDKINEPHPKYPVIIYNYAIKNKKRLKNIALTTTKLKSIKNIFIIILIGILLV